MSTQQAQPKQAKDKGAKPSKNTRANTSSTNPQGIPEHEIKQNSGVSAGMALQAMQKAWELRQAANAAGDPNAREEILAKAINKEIEAESFGKAAKFTRSGSFQGLAAGAGLGVQPGVTLGKLTGALVGGVVSSVTGLIGGGIGSVYGAFNGPFWDLGEMASHGVRGLVGDFPNWKSTPAQKRALEKMVMQTKETQAPTQEELEKMKSEAPDEMPQSWSQSMPSMPSMPGMPSMPQGAALGLGGLGASMPSWGGKSQAQQQAPQQPVQTNQSQSQQAPQTQTQQQRPQPNNRQLSKQAAQRPREAPKPKEPPTPKEVPVPKEAPTLKEPLRETPTPKKTSTPKKRPAPKETSSQERPTPKKSPKPRQTPKPKVNTSKPKAESPKDTPKPKAAQPKEAPKPKAAPPKEAPKPQAASKPPTPIRPKQTSSSDNKENKSPTLARKPKKLGTKSGNAQPRQPSTSKKAPRKLEPRKPVA